MKKDLQKTISKTVHSLYGDEIEIILSRPEEKFGDYATNVALKLSSKLGRPPNEIAQEIAAKLVSADKNITSAEATGGFINIKLSDQALLRLAESITDTPLQGKTVVVEYSDANPFKILHAGHLYTSIIGDTIANLLSLAGANVHRVNFGGDVGMHVAKSLWAIINNLGRVNPAALSAIPPEKHSEWLSERYIEGNRAFEENPENKAEIIKLNDQIYEIVSRNDQDSPLAKIYWTCRQWSYHYFEQFYNLLGIKFEKYYPESSVFKLGLETVRQHVPDVYQESEGAVVFKGENYGLFTNVFINSKGLPTYSAKDVGLSMQKWQDYHFDKSVIITSNEQRDYMKVVLKSIDQFAPELANATIHLTHGEIKLVGGVKMSSRLGNFLTAMDIIDTAEAASKNKSGSSDQIITIGAVKYSFLKQAIGPDIVYDPDESVSIEGNSGPYLQYAYVRASNILKKANQTVDTEISDLTEDERFLLLKISEFSEVTETAVNELKPHHLCTYLYELAQKFNTFYERNRVIGSERQNIRLKLIKMYMDKLAHGLDILGISTPDKM